MSNKNLQDKQLPLKEVDVDVDTYDRNIVPAETAARKEREKGDFKKTIHQTKKTNPESIDTTAGYTVDKEGLANNFAIEPEMYIEEPGDLKDTAEQEQAKRLQEFEEINEDKDGQLTMEKDCRGKGTGII